jgi:hypothetical protein
MRQSGIPESLIYSIHEDVASVPCSKEAGKPGITITHSFSEHGGWQVSFHAHFQGYAPASYTHFIPFIPNCELELVRNGGAAS